MILRHISRLTALAAALGVCLNASAIDTFGYSLSSISSSTLQCNADTYSIAVGLTSKITTGYTDRAITDIEAGLYSTTGLSCMRTLVLSDLSATADTLATSAWVTEAAKGWQRLTLDRAVKIEDHPNMYVVLELVLNQKALLPLGSSGTKGTAQSFWLRTGDGDWNDFCSLLRPACIRMVLGAAAPEAIRLDDAWLSTRSVGLDAAGQPSDSIRLEGRVHNVGNNPLTSFTLSVSTTSGQAPLQVTYQCPGTPYDEKIDFQFAFLPDNLRAIDRQIDLSISAPNGKDNPIAAELTQAKLYYEVYRPHSHTAPLLVEEFTSLRNGYAPCGTQHLDEALQEVFPAGVEGGQYIRLTRHEGYGGDDGLRAASNSDYSARWFGSEALAFAPAAWFHRQITPCSTTLPCDSLVSLIRQHNAERPTASCDLSVKNLTFSAAERKVTADVLIGCDAATAFTDPRLFVVVCADTLETAEPSNYLPDLYPTGTQSLHTVIGYLCDAKIPSADGIGLYNNASTVEASLITSGREPAAKYFEKREGSDLAWHRYTVTGSLLALPNVAYPGMSVTVVAYLYDTATGQIAGATQYRTRL